MCLIVEKPASKSVKPEWFGNVWNKNNDGWGIMWINRRGNPTIKKGLKFQDFVTEYEKLKYKHLFIHFRYTTHGLNDDMNTHPHRVLDDVFMMHNGIFRDKFDFKLDLRSDKSDTVQFVDQIVRPLLVKNGGAEYMRDPEFLREIARYTHNTCKLVFLDKKGFMVVEPHYWSQTLTGLRVSNNAMYSMDNPNYNVGRKTTIRSTFTDNERGRYGAGHNSNFQSESCEINDSRFDDESYVGGQYSNGRSVVTTTTPEEKDATLRLAVNNANDNSKPSLDIKARLSVNEFDLDKAMFLLEATDEEVEELIGVDKAYAARLIKATLSEIQEYGYSAEKFRLGGGAA